MIFTPATSTASNAVVFYPAPPSWFLVHCHHCDRDIYCGESGDVSDLAASAHLAWHINSGLAVSSVVTARGSGVSAPWAKAKDQPLGAKEER